jgi:hypothetical protein
MAGRSANVNDFLLGRDNGEGQVSTGAQGGAKHRNRPQRESHRPQNRR